MKMSFLKCGNKLFSSYKIFFNPSSSLCKFYSVKYIRKAIPRTAQKNEIGPLGWLLFVIPTSTFCLGTWQVKRKMWKENLIADLQHRTNKNPVPLPDNLEDIQKLEYEPVIVRGHFLHDRELYLGPRTLLVGGDASTESSLVSSNSAKTTQGFLIITPFKLADRDTTILVNRGWVSTKNKNPANRTSGQVEGTVDIVGLVRLHENRPVFMPKNKADTKNWLYRDLHSMAALTGSSPIFVEAISECNTPGGPIGGQTRISLRNEHLSYILTWYGLCIATSLMWYRRFIRGLPLK